MIEIGINNISKTFGFDKIFNDISFEVNSNERVALIGNNGCGKSTILNIIYGLESVDNGTVSIRNGSKVGYLRQDNSYINGSIIVRDLLYSNIKDILDLKARLENIEKEMLVTSEKYLYKVIEKYTKLQEKFISLGGYEIDSKINKVINDLNINKELLDKEFGSLSGGEKTLINFASIMVFEPNILLLDEPTNHLDIKTLKWLEEYLVNYKGTLVVVSHDRYFLNKVVNKVIYLKKNSVDIYYGNYDYFKNENENKILREFKEYNDQKKIINAMKNKIKQLEEFGRKASPNGGEMFYRRANSIRKRLEKLDKINKPVARKELPVKFNTSVRTGNEVLVGKNINIGYEDKIILENSSFDIFYRDRVCLFGKNGCGKSSLIKDIIYYKEKYKFGTNINVGYIPQEIEFENDKLTVLDEARKYFIGEEYQLRSALNKFEFFKDSIYKRLNILSGGEKVRLKLFCLIQSNVNFLILDEVTNHIDIDTREVLENALDDFNGTILLVSHDRYFINRLCNRILYFKDNNLYNYNGRYEDFINFINM